MQMNRQHKQCFNCPMSSVKAVVAKSEKKNDIHCVRIEVRKPSDYPATSNVKFFKNYTFIMSKPQRDMNALSLHSSQF